MTWTALFFLFEPDLFVRLWFSWPDGYPRLVEAHRSNCRCRKITAEGVWLRVSLSHCANAPSEPQPHTAFCFSRDAHYTAVWAWQLAPHQTGMNHRKCTHSVKKRVMRVGKKADSCGNMRGKAGAGSDCNSAVQCGLVCNVSNKMHCKYVFLSFLYHLYFNCLC